MKLVTALFSCLTIFGLAFFFEEIFQSTITTENSAQNLLESWLRSFFRFRSLSLTLQMITNYSLKPHKYHLTHIHESIKHIASS